MFPHLETERVPTIVPPPRGFRSLSSPTKITSIRPAPDEYESPRGNTLARAGGLRYERTVQEYVLEIAAAEGFSVYIQPTITFRTGNEIRTCRPDAVFVGDRYQIVAEIKIQHMPEAWWQLRRLYQPILETLGLPTHVLEIVKTFDAAMPFPEHVCLVDSFLQYLATPTKDFTVFVWRP